MFEDFYKMFIYFTKFLHCLSRLVLILLHCLISTLEKNMSKAVNKTILIK